LSKLSAEAAVEIYRLSLQSGRGDVTSLQHTPDSDTPRFLPLDTLLKNN